MTSRENSRSRTRKAVDTKTEEKRVKHKCDLCPYSTTTLQMYKDRTKLHSSEKPFKCPECPYRTNSNNCLGQHLKNIHLPQTRPFPCSHPGCSYSAKRKWDLQTHSKIHSGEKSFFCSHPNCNYSANTKFSLIYHTQIHTGAKQFVCQFESCSYAATTRSQLVTHTRTHTKERPYKCPEANCKYAAAQISNLNKHQLTHEPKEGEELPSFPCPLCEYKGKTKDYLTQHIQIHTLEKLFKCNEPNCSYETRTRQSIKFHKSSKHSDEKPFACSFESCDYRCKNKTDLSTHLKSHSEERRYKCQLCPFRGKVRSTVYAHLKNAHSDPNFRPFKCTEPKCNYAAKTKAHLNKHLLIHNGEKKYACSSAGCDYRAKREAHVKEHEYRIHSDEKREKCSICDHTFKLKSQLNNHKKNHNK